MAVSTVIAYFAASKPKEYARNALVVPLLVAAILIKVSLFVGFVA